MSNEINEFDLSKMTHEEKQAIEDLKELVNQEKLEPTTAFNIIINAVQVCFEQEYFNDLDRYLISKSLDCFREYVDKGEDIVIKVN